MAVQRTIYGCHYPGERGRCLDGIYTWMHDVRVRPRILAIQMHMCIFGYRHNQAFMAVAYCVSACLTRSMGNTIPLTLLCLAELVCFPAREKQLSKSLPSWQQFPC